ncbi:MAG: hypothetical protein VXY99_06995, partial [Pseudomonadota bacterium]|nr:hypothetical protein [Pseudomonadota bacterium]
MEPFQFGLPSGGPDAFAAVAWEPFLLTENSISKQIVTLEVDIKQNYPETDLEIAASVLSNNFPWLSRAARTVYSPSIITVRRPDSKLVDLIPRLNGLSQGLSASSAIAGAVISELVQTVRKKLIQFYLANGLPLPENNDDAPTPWLTVVACHDNLLLHVHRSAASYAINTLRHVAKSMKYRLDDWGIFLHGQPRNRDDTEQFLLEKFPDEEFFKRVTKDGNGKLRRADISNSREDILTVMGVPVYNVGIDEAAMEQWFMHATKDYCSFTDRALQLREQALSMQHGGHTRFAPPLAATQLAPAAIKMGTSHYFHIAKILPIDPISVMQFYKSIDDLTSKAITSLLGLSAIFDNYEITTRRVRRILSRSCRTGGAGITSLSLIAAPSQVTARSNTARLLARACNYHTLNETGAHRMLVKCVSSYMKCFHDAKEELEATRSLSDKFIE